MSVDSPVAVTFLSPSAELGGSEHYLLSLLGELDRASVDRIILLAAGPAERAFSETQLPLMTIDSPGRFGVALGAARLRREFARRPPSIVHANGVKAALVACLALAGSRTPVVWVKHDFSWDGPLARWLARRCAVIVGVSEAVLDSVRSEARESRVVPNGLPPLDVDVTDARASLLAAAGASANDELIVQVGRIEPGKGQLDAVEALATVRRERPHARLAIVGPASRFAPDYERRVRDRARELGVAENVSILGYRSDATDLIAGADAVLIPTHPYSGPGTGEGFGLVALEAMALGAPVVAYAVGGLPEVLGEAGLLVRPLAIPALAASLVELLGDRQLRERLVDAGRRRASGYDWKRTAAAMREVYRDASTDS